MAGSTPETTSESQGAADFSPRGADQPTDASPRGTDQPADETAPRPRNRLAAIAGGPARGAHTDAYRLRPWFTVFLAWLALLTVIALTALGRYEQGVLGAQGVWLTSVGLFYLSLCCVFFPAPTAWIVMLLASNELALIEAVPLRVLAVSCACSLASAVANLNEYHVLTFLLRYRRIAQVREARVYQRTAEWFS
ncbi:MAG: hypothetical protein GY842_27430, partial [bacterium]|nr:hypothetical protein [bacterium]